MSKVLILISKIQEVKELNLKKWNENREKEKKIDSNKT